MFQAVIVGRPNVGKSTLFNTLIGERKAIVERAPGVTRDFLFDYVDLKDGYGIRVVDTGGLEWGSEDFFSQKIFEIVDRLVDEANLILFVVSAKEGLTAGDEVIAEYLRKKGKRVLLVVNKVDGKEDEAKALEFFKLGFDEIVFISAKSAKNIDLLKEKLLELAEGKLERIPEKPLIKIAVYGRPNVGKSTLVNRLVGFERMIVSEFPGTTRDCVDILLTTPDGKNFLIIDTPGIRRRARIDERVEKFSVDKALDELKRVDVVLFMITAEEGLTHQDKTLLRQIAKNYRPCLLLVNKWDLFDGRREAGNVFLELLKHELKFMDYVPVLTISAKTGRRVVEILPIVEELYKDFHRRIPTSKLNALLEEIKTRYSFTIAGKRLKIYYAAQVEVAPPTFVFFVNVDPETIPRHVQKFFERKIREVLGFSRVPVRPIFRERR